MVNGQPEPVAGFSLKKAIGQPGDPNDSRLTIAQTLALVAMLHARRDVTGSTLDPLGGPVHTTLVRSEPLSLRDALYVDDGARALGAASGTFNALYLGSIPLFVPDETRGPTIREWIRLSSEHGWTLAIPVDYREGPDEQIEGERLTTPIQRGSGSSWRDSFWGNRLDFNVVFDHPWYREVPDADLTGHINGCAPKVMPGGVDIGRYPEAHDAVRAAHRLYQEDRGRAVFSVLGFRGISPGVLGPFVLMTAGD